MTIFFGACSGKRFGKVIVKRPFSKVALICSPCTTVVVSKYSESLNNVFEKNIPVYLEVAEGYVRTSHEDVRLMCIRYHEG